MKHIILIFLVTIGMGDLVAADLSATMLLSESVVKTLAFSHDSSKILTGLRDKVVEWDLSTGQEQQKLGIYYVSPWRKLQADGSHELSRNFDGIRAVASDDGGDFIAVGTGDNVIRIFDAKSGKRVAKLCGHSSAYCLHTMTGHMYEDLYYSLEHGVTGLALCKTSPVLVSTGVDGTVRQWDLRNYKQLSEIKNGFGYAVRSLAISHDDQMIATDDDEHNACVWERTTEKLVNACPHRFIKNETRGVWSVAFSGDDGTLASGGEDSCVRLWSVVSGNERTELPACDNAVKHVACHPKLATVACGACENKIYLFDMGPGGKRKEIRTYLWEHEIASPFNAPLVAFSPDGAFLAGAGRQIIISSVYGASH